MRARDVVFVDGVRTPFGKSGPKGIYAETRADDLVVRVIRELLRRNPDLPHDRIGEVAIAATTQIGDQGLTIGRSAAILAGLPVTVPGYAIDRMCAGAMTAVTTVGRRGGARRRRHRDRGRRRAHGPPPDGRGRSTRTRGSSSETARRRVRAVHGHDRGEPARPVPGDHQGAGRRVRAGQPAQGRRRLRGGPDPAGPGPDGDPHRRSSAGAGRRWTSRPGRRRRWRASRR